MFVEDQCFNRFLQTCAHSKQLLVWIESKSEKFHSSTLKFLGQEMGIFPRCDNFKPQLRKWSNKVLLLVNPLFKSFIVLIQLHMPLYLHSSGSELPAVETHRILFSHPLFLFLWTMRSNTTDNSAFPSVISTSAFPFLKASVMIFAWSSEYFVHVDLAASISQVKVETLVEFDAAPFTAPFASTFDFFARTVGDASGPSELATKSHKCIYSSVKSMPETQHSKISSSISTKVLKNLQKMLDWTRFKSTLSEKSLF